MMFDWKEYLNLANSLHHHCEGFSNQEACWRTAISRSYYAVFCTARDYAEKYDGVTIIKGDNSHAVIQKHYGTNSDKDRKRVGNILRQLRLDRNDADYKYIISSLELTSEAALRRAQTIMDLLQKIYTITPSVTGDDKP